MRLTIAAPEEMERFAACCAECLPAGFKLYLQGELGAGKTTFVRGMLRGLGYQGVVKSPTYTLVESYRIASRQIHHFDLYRMETPTELPDIGYQDYFDGRAVCLVEWPERGQGQLPLPDCLVNISIRQAQRELSCHAHGAAGERHLQQVGSRLRACV